MFYDCERLGQDRNYTLNIPVSVETIGDYAFYNCKTLVNVNIESNVIGNHMFDSCKYSFKC